MRGSSQLQLQPSVDLTQHRGVLHDQELAATLWPSAAVAWKLWILAQAKGSGDPAPLTAPSRGGEGKVSVNNPCPKSISRRSTLTSLDCHQVITQFANVITHHAVQQWGARQQHLGGNGGNRRREARVFWGPWVLLIGRSRLGVR